MHWIELIEPRFIGSILVRMCNLSMQFLLVTQLGTGALIAPPVSAFGISYCFQVCDDDDVFPDIDRLWGRALKPLPVLALHGTRANLCSSETGLRAGARGRFPAKATRVFIQQKTARPAGSASNLVTVGSTVFQI